MDKNEEGFFSRYFVQPIKNFYNRITGKTEELGDAQSIVTGVVQESLESLGIYVQSNDNDII